MSGDADSDLQALIDRLREGDAEARRRLLERAYERLRRLAGTLLHQSFPRLADRHEVDSILNESWLRLVRALETVHPPTVADFFRLAAHKVRQVLLDLVERERRLAREEALRTAEGSQPGPVAGSAGTRTYDPERLALWTEFHRRVAALADAEREVFELHYYLGLSQAEVARLLDLHPRKVSYLWVAATEKLAEGLGDGLV